MFEDLEDLLLNENSYGIMTLMDHIKSSISDNIHTTENITCDLIDLEFLGDIKNTINERNIPICFGETLRELKLVVSDDSCREHEVFVKYLDPKKLQITALNLPHSSLQDQEYKSLYDIVKAVKKHIENLSDYFTALEKIDKFCTVMEPLMPSFKDDYRRILIDERTWLHVEVSLEGLAANVYIIGQSEEWTNKLQSGLLMWNHDLDIVENIMAVFDLVHFPTTSDKLIAADSAKEKDVIKENLCGICLCSALPDHPGLPLPLCQNSACGVYFHRSCLFQWLVASVGGRPPAFGVSIGSCPACFQQISCKEKDD